MSMTREEQFKTLAVLKSYIEDLEAQLREGKIDIKTTTLSQESHFHIIENPSADVEIAIAWEILP